MPAEAGIKPDVAGIASQFTANDDNGEYQVNQTLRDLRRAYNRFVKVVIRNVEALKAKCDLTRGLLKELRLRTETLAVEYVLRVLNLEAEVHQLKIEEPRRNVQSATPSVGFPALDIISQEISDLRETTRKIQSSQQHFIETTTLHISELTDTVKELASLVKDRDTRLIECRRLLTSLQAQQGRAEGAATLLNEDTHDPGVRFHGDEGLCRRT